MGIPQAPSRDGEGQETERDQQAGPRLRDELCHQPQGVEGGAGRRSSDAEDARYRVRCVPGRVEEDLAEGVTTLVRPVEEQIPRGRVVEERHGQNDRDVEGCRVAAARLRLEGEWAAAHDRDIAPGVVRKGLRQGIRSERGRREPDRHVAEGVRERTGLVDVASEADLADLDRPAREGLALVDLLVPTEHEPRQRNGVAHTAIDVLETRRDDDRVRGRRERHHRERERDRHQQPGDAGGNLQEH